MKSLSNRENPCSNPLHEACSSFPLAAPVILKTGLKAEPVFVNLLRSPGINSQPGGTVRQPYLSYRHAMLHRQVVIESSESIPGLLKCLKIRAQVMNRHWRKSTNKRQAKPEQKIVAAFEIILRISKYF
jgi:hypothetical protein